MIGGIVNKTREDEREERKRGREKERKRRRERKRERENGGKREERERPSVCAFKTSPCVPATCPHEKNMWACCRYTRGRFERTHGDVLNAHTEVFSVTHHNHTPTHTPTHTHRHTPHTPPHARQREEKTEEKKTRQDRGERG